MKLDELSFDQPEPRGGLKPAAPHGEVRAYRADWRSWNNTDGAIHDVNQSARREWGVSNLNHPSESSRLAR